MRSRKVSLRRWHLSKDLRKMRWPHGIWGDRVSGEGRTEQVLNIWGIERRAEAKSVVPDAEGQGRRKLEERLEM